MDELSERYDETVRSVPNGSFFMLRNPGRADVAFLKGEDGSTTRLNDGSYISLDASRPCRIVSREAAIEGVRRDRAAYAAFLRGEEVPNSGPDQEEAPRPRI